MRRTAIIGMIIGIFLMLLGIIQIWINETCSSIDKNTDFWVRNCDYDR